MVGALAPVGLDSNAPTVPLTIDSPLEERLAYAAMAEEGMGALLGLFSAGVPDASGVTTTSDHDHRRRRQRRDAVHQPPRC